MADKLNQALANFIDRRAAPNPKNKWGLLGDNSGTIEVSGRDGFVYVRLSTGGEILEVLNAGAISTAAALAGAKVIIYFDAGQNLWRIRDLMRDSIGGSTGNTITTTTAAGAPQTVSINNVAPAAPVGQANTLVMLSPQGTSTTNITNIVYQTTTNVMEAPAVTYQTLATLQKNVIANGQTVTIASDEYWIVTRGLTNNGSLVYNGELVIIG